MLKQFLARQHNRNSNPQPTPQTEDTEQPIDPSEARRAQENGARLVDVREQSEWDAGHIAEALLCPLPWIASNPDIEAPLDTPLVTYCKAGPRAERAAEILRAAGHTDVRVMRGGFEDWKAAGYPTE